MLWEGIMRGMYVLSSAQSPSGACRLLLWWHQRALVAFVWRKHQSDTSWGTFPENLLTWRIYTKRKKLFVFWLNSWMCQLSAYPTLLCAAKSIMLPTKEAAVKFIHHYTYREFRLACAGSTETADRFGLKEILSYFDGLRKLSLRPGHRKPPPRCQGWGPHLAARCWHMAGWIWDGSCGCPALVKTKQNMPQFRTPTFGNFGLVQLLCEGNRKKLHKRFLCEELKFLSGFREASKRSQSPTGKILPQSIPVRARH